MTQTNIAALERLLRFDPRLVLEGRTELIVKYNGDISRVAQRLGATVEILTNTCAILTIEVEQIPQLYTFPEVEFLEPPKTLTFELRTRQSRKRLYHPCSRTKAPGCAGREQSSAL